MSFRGGTSAGGKLARDAFWALGRPGVSTNSERNSKVTRASQIIGDLSLDFE